MKKKKCWEVIEYNRVFKEEMLVGITRPALSIKKQKKNIMNWRIFEYHPFLSNSPAYHGKTSLHSYEKWSPIWICLFEFLLQVFGLHNVVCYMHLDYGNRCLFWTISWHFLNRNAMSYSFCPWCWNPLLSIMLLPGYVKTTNKKVSLRHLAFSFPVPVPNIFEAWLYITLFYVLI